MGLTIAERYKQIEERKDKAAVRSGRRPEDVVLMAVTKTHSADEINEAVAAGATDIGENRVQEAERAKQKRMDAFSWYAMRECFAMKQNVEPTQVNMKALFPADEDFSELFGDWKPETAE